VPDTLASADISIASPLLSFQIQTYKYKHISITFNVYFAIYHNFITRTSVRLDLRPLDDKRKLHTRQLTTELAKYIRSPFHT